MEALRDANTWQPDLTMLSIMSGSLVDEPETLYGEINQRLGIDRESIEAILPCTPFQRDVIDSAAHDGRHAVGHVDFEIPEDIDAQRLAAAWKETVHRTPALRACTFTSNTGESFQLVLRESFVFSRMYWTSPGLKAAIVNDEATVAIAGPRCSRFVLLDDSRTRRQRLIWTFSYALVDGAFQKRILQRVLEAYKNGHGQLYSLPVTPDKLETEEEENRPRIHQAVGMEQAIQFWSEKLGGLDASVFPHLTSHLIMPDTDAQMKHHTSLASDVKPKWSDTSVCRAALAILLSLYTHSSEALFGVVTEHLHIFEEQMPLLGGPTRTVLPFRVRCAPDQSVVDMMEDITAYDHAMRQFAHVGLCNISKAGDDAATACGFQTVLMVIHRDTERAATDEIHQVSEASKNFAPCENRALLICCEMTREGVFLTARYNQHLIKPPQMARFLRQLGWLIRQLQSSADDLKHVGQLDTLTPEDRVEITNWNSSLLQTQDSLIHSEILTRAVDSPEKPAVFAWDGELTYSELDDVSSRLAAHIKSFDLGRQQLIVPVYFEKSKWVIVSILAVLKAGHAFTLIDPSDPPARVTQIIEQTSATIALTSKQHQHTMKSLIHRCIVVDDALLQSFTSIGEEGLLRSAAKPQDLAYVIFTSGSTGKPKGIMIEHRAFASCVVKFGPALGIHSSTRSLQFASHGFGACLLEIMTTLIHGGCVCIPSDNDRMHNVPEFIRRHSINWLMATPSYVTTLTPEDVPGLRTLALVGEQMSASVNDTWAPRLQLLDGYGQSESSSICFVGTIASSSSEPNNIGRAIGAHAWIISPHDSDRLVPVGAVGELLIESPGIARDYIDAQVTDRQSFLDTVPSWYSSKQLPDGVKFYRTGDLARYAADGTIVCLGRMDSQVKVRGQRVEMSAIETRLRQQLPSDVTVVAEAVRRPDLFGSVAITVFLIGSTMGKETVNATSTEEANILEHSVTQEINAKLQQVLPAYSVPSHYICMKALPRTATGKVDRRRLRAIGSNLLQQQAQGTIIQTSRKPNALATEVETKIEEIWMQTFRLTSDSLSTGATFFELGGDSITAIKMVNMAKSAGLELKVSDIFQNPTLARLQAVVSGSSSLVTVIPTSTLDGPVEQSYSQGRLWFLDQLEIGALWYLIPYAVRMQGTLHTDALHRALLALEQRHETLRTTFENQDGMGMQIVHQKLAKDLRIIDISDDNAAYRNLLEQEQTTPFDLTSEAGWRATLIRLGENNHVLSIVMHHIISDGWSIDVLRRELGQLYTAAVHGADLLSVLRPLPIQYRDFSTWQRQANQVAEHDRQLDYWRKQLADCLPAKLPTDFPRPALLSGEAGSVPVTITGELYQRLQKFCNRLNTTPFVVLLTAFRAAHYRLTGVDDAVIGTPIANRNRRELENLIGFFVNTQCMRITVDDDETFDGLVRQVQSTTTAAFEHEDIPFERVVSAMLPGVRDLSQNPLAQLIFAIHSQNNLGNFELEGLQSEPLPSKNYTRFDAEFHFFQAPNGLSGYLNFAAELFRLESMQNVVSVFLQILRHGLDQPQTLISVLPLADGLAELRGMGLMKINEVEYPQDLSVVDVFCSQAAASPDALAVVDSSSRLTYAELDHQSDLLATWLRRYNLPAETLVAVLAPRSCQTIIAYFGILKANLAYLPLDTRSPVARMKDILSTLPGHIIILLGSDVAAPNFQLPSFQHIRIDDALEATSLSCLSGREHTHVPSPSATSLAYVLYTSGSTGKPKGVMIEHRVIVRLAKSNIIPDWPPESGAIMAHMFNTAFDGATFEIYMTLLNGGTLVCVDYMTTLSPKVLEAVFEKENVNTVVVAPALLKLYLADARDALKKLDVLIAAGDRFDSQDAFDAQNLIRGACYNAYGPTENGVISTLYKVDTKDPFINGVPLGRAVNNSGAYIADPSQQLVGPSVLGELIVTGSGLARGYTDRTLDKNRFIQINIDGETVKGYRTGDRVRYRAGEGIIEFFGRIDFQFKIRSNRIEAAEVEAAILSHPSVHDAAVVLVAEENQEPEIVGFVVSKNSNTKEPEETGSQVQIWRDYFESHLYTEIDTISSSDIGRDFKGWTSMYDGSEINKEEMQEWLDDTIRTIRDGQSLGNVLEIGTGSGMILFNLGSGLQSYVGLEPSKSAVAFVTNAIKSIPALATKAEVHVGTATDIDQLRGLRPDLVVFNSVVQYFPTPEYLAMVVDTLVRMGGIKRLFFGDIRSQATNRHFLAARAIHTLGRNATKDEVRKMMAELEESEEELLVEPAFFTTLASRLPDLIEHVEIIPKNMIATNELSAYRYAAIIHLRDSDTSAPHVYSIAMEDCIDFQASGMHRGALREYLRLFKNATTVFVSNIPCRKTIFERLIAESLDENSENARETTSDGAAWISAIRSEAESIESLSVPDLFQIAEESGYRVEVSAARQWSQRGALDAVFHRYQSSQPTVRTLFRFPTDNEIRMSATLANRPLQRIERRRIALQVRERLKALIPSYMIPSHVVALDHMPLNANGKVDRKGLTRMARMIKPTQKPAPVPMPVPVFPVSDIEAILLAEATATFGMEVSVTDDFFKLGGHSLLAMKLIARICHRLGARLTVRDVFDHPAFSELAEIIRQNAASQNAVPESEPLAGDQQKPGSTSVAPRTEMEKLLCEEFASVLGVEVGITDNFFDLGGHSLMATRLAARIGHRLNITVSVKNVFDYPVLFQLASKLELAQLENLEVANLYKTTDYSAFQLLSVEDPQSFIDREISPRLLFPHGKIQDVYPVTHMQKGFLRDASTTHPKPLVPFYVDFPPDSDPPSLARACASLIKNYDIFRTIFVEAAGELYQVALEHLDLAIDIIETEENVHTASSDFVDRIGKEPVRLGQPMIRITILKQISSVRVLLWLSHALYDGLSLEHIVRDLHILSRGKSLPPPNQFSQYMQYVAHTRTDGYGFWRDVIQNVPITTLSDTSSGGSEPEVGAARALHVSKVVSIPLQAIRSSITQATVFNASCAVVLSKETGAADVVFGRIVSGRQGLPISWQNIIGPCTNAVPVRARVDGEGNHQQMLQDMQDQYLLSLPFETVGFDEIRRRCTDWPATATNYGCCVTYHNFEYHPESEVDQQRVEMGVLAKKAELQKEEPLYDFAIAGEVEPDGAHLQVTVVAKARLFSEMRAKYLLEEVCKTFQALNMSL
ncbi:hypothetical protein NQ176_g3070 [Zarea fungicola]|uniref:Uncharacterized protein n=1 Tax=Zarea fungicola TaxID=93591 RepID=A0ACC1NKX8_9HYPO|nr:hypothetical protein NQ176_g3070 [Lecanicillium fungicola]